jgi:hypothetical protein
MLEGLWGWRKLLNMIDKNQDICNLFFVSFVVVKQGGGGLPTQGEGAPQVFPFLHETMLLTTFISRRVKQYLGVHRSPRVSGPHEHSLAPPIDILIIYLNPLFVRFQATQFH